MFFLLTALLMGAQSCTSTAASTTAATTSADHTTEDLAVFAGYTTLLDAQATTALATGTTESVALTQKWLLNLQPAMLAVASLESELVKTTDATLRATLTTLLKDSATHLNTMKTADAIKNGDASYLAHLAGLFAAESDDTKALSVALMPVMYTHYKALKALDAYKSATTAETRATTLATFTTANAAFLLAVGTTFAPTADKKLQVQAKAFATTLSTYLGALADIQKAKFAAAA